MKKLVNIQSELKAPKGNFNSFGKYKYRSCEDILESVKPLLQKYNCTLVLSDEIVQVGDRYYIKASATLTDEDNSEQITNTALARESLEKKGMDDAQITGTASSYARKYALNGLFAIDDTKDADTDEYKIQQQDADAVIDNIKKEALESSIVKNGITDDAVEKVLKKYGFANTSEITISKYGDIVADFRKLCK